MKRTRYLFVIGICVLSFFSIKGQAALSGVPLERSFVLFDQQAGVYQPEITLNGTWQFKFSPKSKWEEIQVPGEVAMQGYAIEHDKPFVYRRSLTLPADYRGKRVILRFDGVYGQARLSINGTVVREHQGGFTRWETDITPYVKYEKRNEIQLEVTDRIDDISYASGYAHHPIGGILRDVSVFALPQTYIYDLGVETHLDSLYRNAVLKLTYSAAATENSKIEFTLTSPDGKKVEFAKKRFILSKEKQDYTHEFSVENPLKWDAEHPNLYTLTVSVSQNQKEVGRFSRKIGFRDVRIVGDRMYVNGMQVKLRGACRHDIHPTLGRVATAEIDSLDAVLFKQSNMNFVRTSHYPPTERFVEYCDKYGIYVECEAAVCFVDTYRQKNYAPGKTQDDTAYTDRYLSQVREMVRTFRSHPSVLFWSVGNESVYGLNFQRSFDWVKETDVTRPVVFSYPGSVSQEKKIYEILSMHYQDVNGDLDQWNMKVNGYQGHGIPALFDEWAHVPCYTYNTLQNDPNIREFWGISLDKMWSGLFDAPGGLGGAIWGYIDETFMLPAPKVGTAYWKEFARTAKPEGYQGKSVGYGEWGIVDVWRRHKPEFWSTKKAYSPVRLLTVHVPEFTLGECLMLPVYNRFDHTNLNEIKATYTYNGVEKGLSMASVEPHEKGMLIIPGEAWSSGKKVVVKFFTKEQELIDAYEITLGQEQPAVAVATRKGELAVTESGDKVVIKGDGFEIPFCKETGLLCRVVSKGEVVIVKGPFLNLDVNLNHLTGAEVRRNARKFVTSETDWKKDKFSYEQKEGRVCIDVSGAYDSTLVRMHFVVFPEGRMEISYWTSGEPNGWLREAGMKFLLPDNMDRLKWERKGYWSYYPENSFAGNTGDVPLYNNKQVVYASNPLQPWHMDTHNYFYFADAGTDCEQPLTQVAKGMKENIYSYSLSTMSRKSGLSVTSSDASVACRINKLKNQQLVLYINNRWDYPEIAWGDYCKTLEVTPCYGKMNIIF